MILIEFTMSGLQRVSIEQVALEHFWEPWAIAFDPPQYAMATDYGGYVKLGFGSISLSPDAFSSDWPPPLEATITAKYTATTEAAAETLFTGKAYLSSTSQTEITYDLYEPSYTATEAASTAYNDTLVNVFTAFCTTLSLTLNSTAARATSPAVNYTLPSLTRTIDLASEMAAAYSHLFYISGSTLYLVDMLGNNGTRTITEFDYFEGSSYWQEIPVNIASTTNFSRTSSYPYGGQITITEFHPTQANVETYLDDILTTLAKPKSTIETPLLGSLPVPGEQISWTDASLAQSTAITSNARMIRYDFMNDSVQITGEGTVT